MRNQKEIESQIEKADTEVDSAQDLVRRLEQEVESRRKTTETDDTGHSGDYD